MIVLKSREMLTNHYRKVYVDDCDHKAVLCFNLITSTNCDKPVCRLNGSHLLLHKFIVQRMNKKAFYGFHDGNPFNCIRSNLIVSTWKAKAADKWKIKYKDKLRCSNCKCYISIESLNAHRIYRHLKTGVISCSSKCRILGNTYRKSVPKWIKRNNGKLKCEKCGSFPVYLFQSDYFYFKNKKHFHCLICREKPNSKKHKLYKYIQKNVRYCQCEKCRKLGDCFKTQIYYDDKLSFRSIEKMMVKNLDMKYCFNYLPHHGPRCGKIFRCLDVCKRCGKNFWYTKKGKKTHFLLGYCSGLCCGYCRTNKSSRFKRVEALIESIKEGTLSVPKHFEKGKFKFLRPRFPRWCSICRKTDYVLPRRMLTRRLPLCNSCRELSEKRLCFCGWIKGAGVSRCRKHGLHLQKKARIIKEIKKMKEKLNKEQVVNRLIDRIHSYITKWKTCEAEALIGIMELERLEAHKIMPVYRTFAELIEGEFGWTEVKYKSAKNMFEIYNIDRYKEYGRETLQCISRLDQEAQKKLFSKISQYQIQKNGKIPGYGLVNRWVRDEAGKMFEKKPPNRIVDIKSKYVSLLEENRKLRQKVNELEVEIAKLNIFLQKNRKLA